MIRACYPVHRRGDKITWSGSPFYGKFSYESVEKVAQAASQRAHAKGTNCSKKSDVPGVIWLEVQQDALFSHTAIKVTPLMLTELEMAEGAGNGA